ncbi:adenylyl-sulfate kinase [Fundidesulfovibrio butyratiphilus]
MAGEEAARSVEPDADAERKTPGASLAGTGDGPEPAGRGGAVWFTGLPGSGKSTLARCVAEALRKRGVDLMLLEMDARRHAYCPHPTYDEAERDRAYGLFVREAVEWARLGKLVLMDASAPKLAMRALARGMLERFFEVHLRCPVRTAMERESSRPQGVVMAGLYAKAIRRKMTGEQFEGLGQVVGVDVPFEEDPRAELTLDAGSMSVAAMCDRVLERLAGWWV